MRPRVQRIARLAAASIGVVLALVLLSFAIPIPVWRTGELPAPPLPAVEGGPPVGMADRVWVDTDAACGSGRRVDPDDCFAILLLARSPELRIVGISTVFGNASLPVTDSVTRALAERLRRDGLDSVPVYRGSAEPMTERPAAPPPPAHGALRSALEQGRLTLVALGPLTNIAAVLRERPELGAGVARLVAVMGRRPGHVFHPAEAAGGGILFGHGPVFRDFNFEKDRAAAIVVLRQRLPTTLVPYDAARRWELSGSDLDRMKAGGGAAAWVASRAAGWLDYWRAEVGRGGFYPFDLLAGAYVLDHRSFTCAEASAWVAPDRRLWHGLPGPVSLLVGLEAEAPRDALARAAVVYCLGAGDRTPGSVMERLARGPLGSRHRPPPAP